MIKPDWQHNASYTRYGKTVLEIPIVSTSKFSLGLRNAAANKISYNQAYSRSSFILLYDGKNYDAYVMTILADSDYIKSNPKKLGLSTYRKRDPTFTGLVLYFKPDGRYAGGYRYNNGKLVVTDTQTDTKNTNSAKLKVDETTPAPVEVYCEETDLNTYENGELVSSVYLYTVCYSNTNGTGSSGGAPAAPPCVPPTGNPPVVESVSQLKVDQVTPPPTPVGGGDGDGGLPPPATPQPCVVSVVSDDPCSQVNQLNATAANAIISAQNAVLLNDSKTSPIEQGYAQNLQTLTGTTYNPTPVITATAATPDQLNTTFSWDPTNGYTIGFTHDHPNGSGPSPEDIFAMLINSKSQKLASAGSSAIAFYKANSSVTVVTKTNNYVVTVNDWAAIQTLYNTYLANPTAFDQAVVNNSRTSSYEASILNTFGGAINLYTDGGKTGKYYPLNVNSSNYVAETPCPTN